MTIKTALAAISSCAVFVSLAMAAPPAGSTGQTVTPSASGPLTPLPKGVQDKMRPVLACRPDLTISRIILTRSGPTRNIISVSVEVKNIGRDSFVSDPRQAGVSAVLTNGNTNGVTNLDLGSIAELSGGSARIYNGITGSMPFDTFEFGGEVRAAINYDPDITIDGQPCNDDAVYANNTFAVSNDAIRAWLGTSSNRLQVSR
jgi:hypothetical protein